MDCTMTFFHFDRGVGTVLAGALLVGHGATFAAEPFDFDVAAGNFDEHCLRIEAGEAIRWRFTATAAVDFNIHAHRGEQVIYPVRRDGVTRASGTFRAKGAEEYCLMWTNRGAAPVSARGAVQPG
jgi:hypothetical protein